MEICVLPGDRDVPATAVRGQGGGGAQNRTLQNPGRGMCISGITVEPIKQILGKTEIFIQ